MSLADVISGGQGITVTLRVSEGARGKTMPIFTIFKNKDSNYPIADILDDVNGKSYCTVPCGWMDRRVFLEMLSERRIIAALLFRRTRVIFVDNEKVDMQTPEQLKELSLINKIIQNVPFNATNLVHPLEEFPIHCLKSVWRRE